MLSSENKEDSSQVPSGNRADGGTREGMIFEAGRVSAEGDMVMRSATLAALATGTAAFMAPSPVPSLRRCGTLPLAAVPRAVPQSSVRCRSPFRLSATARASAQRGSSELAVLSEGKGRAPSKRTGALFATAAVAALLLAPLAATAKAAVVAAPAAGLPIYDAKFWGFLGAIAGWGMSLAAIKDAAMAGPEIISPNMTFVMLIYSGLFAWWAWVVSPQNLLLCACHTANICAQSNQMRRLIAYLKAEGKTSEVMDMGKKALLVAVAGVASIVGGPAAQGALAGAGLGAVSTIAAAKAGPFTVHFWAPMSKWLISGASFLDLKRPTDQISIAQYSALTLTGFFFVPYALLVNPINYILASVNIALFVSSAWQLGRKVKADYFSSSTEPGQDPSVPETAK